MKIMVGIDLHSNNALCGLMDESGQRLVHKKLPCELPPILQLLEPYKERIATIAVESTFNWYWLPSGSFVYRSSSKCCDNGYFSSNSRLTAVGRLMGDPFTRPF